MNKNYTSPTPLNPMKKAVIIGASRGLGAALAKRLAKEGYNLALASRSIEDLTDLANQINTGAGEVRARVYLHDAANFKQAAELLPMMMADLGGLDLFIYNTGILNQTELDGYNFESDREMIDVNLVGAMAWLNPVAEIFQSLGKGHIVGISSVAGDRGRVMNPAYGASKAALSSYLESYRNRLSKKGVHVLTVKPGFMDTAMTKGRSGLFFMSSPEQAAQKISKAIRSGKQTIYVSSIWGVIMLIIRHIPSFLFRKMTF